MDLPTFKKYLRRKAIFRLLVVGLEWVETVKGENNWRLGLYESWLIVVKGWAGGTGLMR